LGENAESMKFPFLVSIMGENKNYDYLASRIRKPHPHADMGVEN
jgi:hypothetical protein